MGVLILIEKWPLSYEWLLHKGEVRIGSRRGALKLVPCVVFHLQGVRQLWFLWLSIYGFFTLFIIWSLESFTSVYNNKTFWPSQPIWNKLYSEKMFYNLIFDKWKNLFHSQNVLYLHFCTQSVPFSCICIPICVSVCASPTPVSAISPVV